MSDHPSEPQALSTDNSHRGVFAGRIAIGVTIVLFVLAALFGGEITDRGILPLVRFISLLMLALGVYTSVMVGRYLSSSRNRWVTGQVAAGCIGFAGGFVWSATAYGAGFIFFMIGILVCTLLVFKAMERRTNRLLARRKSVS